MRWVEDNGFFSMPPEEHTRLRKLFSAALTPRAVKRYEAQVREMVERFAAPLRRAQRRDRPDGDLRQSDPERGDQPHHRHSARGRRRACASAELAQSTIRGFFSFSDEATKQAGDDAFVEIATWVREHGEGAPRRHSART